MEISDTMKEDLPVRGYKELMYSLKLMLPDTRIKKNLISFTLSRYLFKRYYCVRLNMHPVMRFVTCNLRDKIAQLNE